MKLISCEDNFNTIITLIEIYIIMKITSLVNDKFILFVIINIIILYAPIEKISPHGLFKVRMFFSQIVEGIVGILECLIPRYEDINLKNKEN